MRRLFLCILPPLLISSNASAALERIDEALKKFKTRYGTEFVEQYTSDGQYLSALTGVPDGKEPVSPDGREFLPYLVAMSGADYEDAFDSDRRVVERLGRTLQYRYPQTLNGQLIKNAYIIIQVQDDGDGPYDILLNGVPGRRLPPTLPRDAKSAQSVGPKLIEAEWQKTQGSCLRRWWTRTTSRRVRPTFIDTNGIRPQFGDSLTEPAQLIALDRRIRIVYIVTVKVTLPRGKDEQIVVALRRYVVDAESTSNDPSKAILRVDDLIRRSSNGKGRIFDPNPVNSLYPKPARIDNLKNKTPPYYDCTLKEINDAVDGVYHLTGTYVALVNLKKADRPPLDIAHVEGHADDFSSERGSKDFAAVMAYCHIDRQQRYVYDNLKFTDLVRKPLPVDSSHDKSSGLSAQYTDDPVEKGYITFDYDTSSGIFATEDADVIAHEYGHALLAAKTKGRFYQGTAEIDKNESGAINEGFSDYWALSSSSAQTMQSGFTQDCFGEWVVGGEERECGGVKRGCIRIYTCKPSHRDFKDNLVDHENGQIWSGVLYAIFNELGRDHVSSDSIILQGHLERAFEGDAPTMKKMAAGIIIADKGAHRDMLCTIFKDHDVEPECCVQKGCTSKLPP